MDAGFTALCLLAAAEGKSQARGGERWGERARGGERRGERVMCTGSASWLIQPLSPDRPFDCLLPPVSEVTPAGAIRGRASSRIPAASCLGPVTAREHELRSANNESCLLAGFGGAHRAKRWMVLAMRKWPWHLNGQEVIERRNDRVRVHVVRSERRSLRALPVVHVALTGRASLSTPSLRHRAWGGGGIATESPAGTSATSNMVAQLQQIDQSSTSCECVAGLVDSPGAALRRTQHSARQTAAAARNRPARLVECTGGLSACRSGTRPPAPRPALAAAAAAAAAASGRAHTA